MNVLETNNKSAEFQTKIIELTARLRVLELELITLLHKTTGESFTSISLEIDHKKRVEFRRLMKEAGLEMSFTDFLTLP